MYDKGRNEDRLSREAFQPAERSVSFIVMRMFQILVYSNQCKF